MQGKREYMYKSKSILLACDVVLIHYELTFSQWPVLLSLTLLERYRRISIREIPENRVPPNTN